MADDATITLKATLLPDEIAKVINGSMIVTPDDANDKWYYKLNSCKFFNRNKRYRSKT